MKVFISQPMRGKTDEEILGRRAEIVAMLHQAFPTKDIDVIDSFTKDESLKEKGSVAMLGHSISLMADADLVIFDWGHSMSIDEDYHPGMEIEFHVAREYKIPGFNIGEIDKLLELPS